MRRLVIGDIHGGFRAMEQVLGRAGFDRDKDLLIGIGDYVDGWPDSWEVVEFLRNLPNFTGVIGNHDIWAQEWLDNHDGLDPMEAPWIWTSQGGLATQVSYTGHPVGTWKDHSLFLGSMPPYLVVDSMLFIHGGCCQPKQIHEYSRHELAWDRDMFMRYFMSCRKGAGYSPVFSGKEIEPYSKVFIGHTSTSRIDPVFRPLVNGGVYAVDTGGGWEGKLTVMDIDTDEIWQSDVVSTLYSEVEGR